MIYQKFILVLKKLLMKGTEGFLGVKAEYII